MLKITVPGGEFYDESRNRFVTVPKTNLQLEHSLVSISKWESIWRRSYFNSPPQTDKERRDYIRCMTMTQNVNPDVYDSISKKQMNQIFAYCESPMTATTVSAKPDPSKKRKIVTSELVYYWMIEYGVPFDPCEKWHINRLMMLLTVCSEKNKPQKKMSKAELAAHHRAVNAARRPKK